MKKRNRKTMTLGAAVLALALIGTACNDGSSGSSPSASPSATASPSASPSVSPSDNPSPSASPEQIEATGKYVGLQDGHSVEIETEQGPTGFQVTPEVAEKVGSWDENTPVKFQYIVEKMDTDTGSVEQKTIVSIDKE